MNLSNLDSRGVDYEYEPRDKTVSYAKQHSYLPDVVLSNGIIIEYKGWFKPSDRTKHLLIKKQHPDLDVRFVFQRASQTLSKSEH